MGIFERYLSVWVALCIVAGIVFGSAMPALFHWFASLQIAGINLAIALFIWLMIYPMMVQVDFSSIKDIRKKPKGIVLTLVVNWLVKPFTMAALGWLFFEIVFADLVDARAGKEYIAGMILLGVAPCTAMVFVWSQLTKGDANYTLVQVSVNDVIMIFAFAPIAGFLLGVSEVTVPWDTLIFSIFLYVVTPLVAGVVTRYLFEKTDVQIQSELSIAGSLKSSNLEHFIASIKPFSILGLLATVVLLFGFQATTILAKPLVIVLIAIPLLLQSYIIFALTYFVAKALKLPHNIAAPACLIGTSNFFELAVAVAISLFGLHSGAALATVVGVLVEVPVMLSLVGFVNRTRHWFA